MSNQEYSKKNRDEKWALSENEEIDFLDMAKFIVKFWPILLFSLIVGAIIPGVIWSMKPFTYTSSSTLYVLSSTTSITSLADIQIGSKLSDDFEVIIMSKPVLDKAIETVEADTGVKLTRESVKKSTTVTHDSDTRILIIKCTTEDPMTSKALCSAITNAAASHMAEITQTDPPTIVESAELAAKPNSRGITKRMVVGAAVAFAAAVMILGLIYITYDKIRQSDDVTNYLGEVTLGVIPYEKTLNSDGKIVMGKRGQKNAKYHA